MKGYAYWVRFIHVELLGNVNVLPSIKVGDTVRVKSSVVTPQYKWGSITHSSVGVVTGNLFVFDFVAPPTQLHLI